MFRFFLKKNLILFSAARLVRPTVIGGMPSLFSALRTYRIDQTNLLGNRLRTVVIGGARSTVNIKAKVVLFVWF
jgi:hypothetical protein